MMKQILFVAAGREKKYVVTWLAAYRTGLLGDQRVETKKKTLVTASGLFVNIT